MSTTAVRTVTRAEVEQAMREGGNTQYINYADPLAEHLNRRGCSAAEVQTFARQRGVTVPHHQAQALVDRIMNARPTEQVSNSTLRDTVMDALPAEARRYSNYAEPVITALEDRERQMAEGIINAAVEDGIETEDVRRTLENVGIMLPHTATNITAEGGGGSVEQQIARLTQMVETLTTAARSRGLI